MIKNPAPITHSLAGVSLNDNHPIHVEKIIDHEKYSTKIKLLGVTAQVFRFVKKLGKQPCTTSPEISANELIEAEKSWIQSIQSTELYEFNNLGCFSMTTRLFGAKGELTMLQSHAESHEIVHHDGIRETLNCVRGKYWVLRGRECVKGVVRRCVKCKKFETKPFPTPKEAVLPLSPVSKDPPFTNTGIDFAGPLYATNNQEMGKVYICLFTCASTRIIL